MAIKKKILLIACGALAREITALLHVNKWKHIELTCLPAKLHNTPKKISSLLRSRIQEERRNYNRIIVLYGDCGTGGAISDVCKEEQVEQISGDHCYAFYMGLNGFREFTEKDPTAYFVTDYLVKRFDRLVWEALGLDKHPQLLVDYFGNYTKLVYLAQIDSPELKRAAQVAAARMGLEFHYRLTGLGDIGRMITHAAEKDVINTMGVCGNCVESGCYVRN